MQFGYSETCLDHDTGPRHPETADRLRAIRRGLAKRHGVEYVDASPAEKSTVAAVHDDGYVDEFHEFCRDGGGNWDPDDGRNTPFSLGRPPGHHAVEDDAMGFCFFNNAAVAAQAVIDDGLAERVAIFDWDVHHGNGTQDIFYDRGDVFYTSIHEDGLYPGTGEVDETGEGDGEGSTLNVPLHAGAGDADYVYSFDEAIAPAVERFDPDLFIVSAGFDAHRHDPISRMRVSTEGYAMLTECVQELCEETDAAIAFVLEGGYGLDTLSEGVATVHETFDGRIAMDPEEDPDEKNVELVDDVRAAHGLGAK